jgi:spore germination protein YaaH
MKRSLILFSTLFFLTFGVFSLDAFAATSFEKAVWIPYWRKTEGASSTLANLKTLTQVSPFAFELQADGTIKNALKFDDEPWTALVAEAKKKKIKVYPSILSYPHNENEKYAFYLLLAQRKTRIAHEKEIVALVKKYNVDGIDIDYEAKTAETRPYFSAFLTELATLLHKNKKQLICTVEARTPPESRYATTSQAVLSKVEYSNDYKVIGKVCDQVRIMAYDQAGDDRQLVNQNTSNGDSYKPVADINWVEKIATLALRDIPAKKIILGIPTYGYKYEIIPATATSSQKYSRLGSMNFNYADELAKSLKITPIRNSAGEISFTYSTSTDINGNQLGSYKQYLVWYSDAVAIADKIRIAKLYKLGGVVIFKVDGGNDPNLWNVLR